jgi:EF-P beta-lysylation protein EpmB
MSSSRNRSIAAHIIPECAASLQTPSWQQALSRAFSDLTSLLDYLHLSKNDLKEMNLALEDFSLRVPREFAALMRPGDANDPLLRQILPTGQELLPLPGFINNPVGDREAEVQPGLLHKYHGRALVIATGACGVHCRYCFRRHYPYEKGSASPKQWTSILAHLVQDETIHEVILSGGDPLMMSDEKLKSWISDLSTIPHLQRLRIHTRLPVIVPQRVTPELLKSLSSSHLKSILVIHANHPNELSAQVGKAIALLKQQGITLLNQSVLLKGVNDKVDILARLSERLFEIGVLPYYLHLLDRVAGAAHFEVDETEALALHLGLRERLPGYLVPTMVREIAGESCKIPVS